MDTNTSDDASLTQHVREIIPSIEQAREQDAYLTVLGRGGSSLRGSRGNTSFGGTLYQTMDVRLIFVRVWCKNWSTTTPGAE